MAPKQFDTKTTVVWSPGRCVANCSPCARQTTADQAAEQYTSAADPTADSERRPTEAIALRALRLTGRHRYASAGRYVDCALAW